MAKRAAMSSGAVLVIGSSVVTGSVPASAATFTVTTNADSGPGSLRDAVQQANATPEFDTVTFAPSLNGATIALSSQIRVADNVLIDASGQDITVSGSNATRIFYLYVDAADDGPITIDGLRLADGVANDGGAIFGFEPDDVVLRNLTVDNNSASGDGGALWLYGEDLTIQDSTFAGNSAGSDGGSIHVDSSTGNVLVDGVTVTGSTATRGGAIDVYETTGSVTITDSTFSGNTATSKGGAVSVYDNRGPVLIDGVTVTGNAVSGGPFSRGGGISVYYNQAPVTIRDSQVDDNSAGRGGGISVYNPIDDVLIADVLVSGNSASGVGGGIFLYEGDVDAPATITITGSTISENSAGDDGGGLQVYDLLANLVIEDSTFSDNVATQDGGGLAFYNLRFDVSLDNVTVTGNEAERSGGGLYADDFDGTTVTLSISNSLIDGNVAGFEGGGAFFSDGNDDLVSIDTTTITGNDAPLGAGIAVDSVGTFLQAPPAGTDAAAPPVANAYYAEQGVVVTRSTIDSNGSFAVPEGTPPTVVGAMRAQSSLVELVNSTVSGNEGTRIGGIAVYSSLLAIEHTTVVENLGSGVEASQSEAFLFHSIFADNTRYDVAGETFVASFNFIEDLYPGASFSVNENTITGPDPMLTPLQNNGGPTRTHLPEPGSPVIDAGDPAIEDAPETDQRHFIPRIVGEAIDLGSVEVGAQPQNPPTGDVQVTIQATDPDADEGGDPGTFTITRTGGTGSALTISYVLSGTAAEGDDYEQMGTITIPAGQSSVTVDVNALADGEEEGDETVILTLQGGVTYTVGVPGAATVTIGEGGGGDPDPCFGAPEDGFVDVPEGPPPTGNVHEAAIDCLFFIGGTVGGPEGLPDNQYGPHLKVSRAQMASFLARIIGFAGIELNPNPPDAFDDPATTHDRAIDQLAEVGIIEGKGPRFYDSLDNITRDQMAAFLFRTYEFITGAPLPPTDQNFFPDDDASEFHDEINRLAAAGIIEGRADGSFGPSAEMDRDQMASFLIRLVMLLAEEGDFPVDEPGGA